MSKHVKPYTLTDGDLHVNRLDIQVPLAVIHYKEEQVVLMGFGIFSVKQRKARNIITQTTINY